MILLEHKEIKFSIFKDKIKDDDVVLLSGNRIYIFHKEIVNNPLMEIGFCLDLSILERYMITYDVDSKERYKIQESKEIKTIYGRSNEKKKEQLIKQLRPILEVNGVEESRWELYISNNQFHTPAFIQKCDELYLTLLINIYEIAVRRERNDKRYSDSELQMKAYSMLQLKGSIHVLDGVNTRIVVKMKDNNQNKLLDDEVTIESLLRS